MQEKMSCMNIHDIKQFFEAWRLPFDLLQISPLQVAFQFKSRRVILQGSDAIGLMRQTFFQELNSDLDVKNKIVVDAGACIGDTAIYFALKGAKRVYAIEPMGSFHSLLTNVKNNGLEHEIFCFPIGLAGQSIDMRVARGDSSNATISQSESGEYIRLLSLADFTKKYGIEKDAVVKMDIEGHEFQVINAAAIEDLRHYQEYLMEIHGMPEPIIGKFINAGFTYRQTEKNSYVFTRE